jgi:hypothetical protein
VYLSKSLLCRGGSNPVFTQMQGTTMGNPIKIENIEEMRRRAGIEDVELREAIRQLRPGDVVKLTFVTGLHSFATLAIRITSIRASVFRGKLVEKPSVARRLGLRAESIIVFTTAHIHSISKSLSAEEQ